MARLTLAAGAWAATLDPDAGGAIASLDRAGLPVLRPTAPGATDPLAFASFPLVPYANRIAHGRFEFDGTPHHLPPNRAGQQHPLHGVGWIASWQIEQAGADRATMVHHHRPDAAWPWDYQARQRLRLDPSGLEVVLAVQNVGDAAMPVSLGFHPYFERAPVTRLRFAAGSVWLTDATLLPTTEAPGDALADWASGAVPDTSHLIDNAYAGWGGDAWLSRDDGDVVLTATGTSLLHLYMPPGEPFFCAEPVTAMPDALNRGAALRLAPGATVEIAMAIRSGD